MDILLFIFNFLFIIIPSFYVYRKILDLKTQIFITVLGLCSYLLGAIYDFKKTTIIMYICVISIYIFFRNKKYIKFITIIIFFYLSGMIIDLFSIFILINILNFEVKFIFGNKILILLIPLLILLINMLIAVNFKKIFKNRKWTFLILKDNKKTFYIIILSVGIMIALMIYLMVLVNNSTVINTNDMNYIILLVTFFFIINLITCYMVFTYGKKEAFVKYKMQEFEAITEYSKTLEGINNDVRKFRHDYVNMLSTMSGYLNENDIKGLKKFFEENIAPLENETNKKNLRLGLLGNINIPEVKGLIVSKVIKSQELGIDILIDVPDNIDVINVDLIDLSRILGIIFDNSIEAAIKSEEKIVRFGIFTKNNAVNIIVINSYPNEKIYIHEIFKEGFSTKGGNRGLGLNILSEIINRHKNIVLDTSIQEKEFIQDILIT
ncbi:MAG: sensor histidine kinase [Sarcina sp.]